MGINKPTADQIAEQENLVNDNIDEGRSAYPGMSYEEGVVAAIRWINGDEPEAPLEEDGE